MHTNFLKIVLVKIGIIFFWIALFLGILYIPKLFEHIHSRNEINVATWTDMLDEAMIKKFEKETGIKVNLSYFDNNDELLIKIRATKGKGYDLIIPSDYTVQTLIEENLLKRFDKTKITVWDRVNPRLLGAYFDPDNQYSIPYYWGIYGIGVNNNLIQVNKHDISWDLIFRPQTNATISMLDSPREAILLTGFYLFHSIHQLTDEKITAIKNLLIKQKKWVEAYTEFRADYLLLSQTCPLVVTTSPLMFRLMNIQKNINFYIPKEGTFTVTDNWAIPAASSKESLTYQLINFLYQPEVITYHFDVFTFIPATVDIETLLIDFPPIYEAHTNTKHKLEYFENVLSRDVLNDIWIALKA